MSKADYEAVSKLIEAVIGKDTIAGVRLVEGIRFYFNSKTTIIKEPKITSDKEITEVKVNNLQPKSAQTNHIEGAREAMKRYTDSLIKESMKKINKKKTLIK